VVAPPKRHPQRDHHQVGVRGPRDVPGHDLLGEHVDDERGIDEPDQLRTSVKSVTRVRFGAAAVKSRSSRSPAHLPSLAGIVV
jgi:hypothetical protein